MIWDLYLFSLSLTFSVQYPLPSNPFIFCNYGTKLLQLCTSASNPKFTVHTKLPKIYSPQYDPLNIITIAPFSSIFQFYFFSPLKSPLSYFWFLIIYHQPFAKLLRSQLSDFLSDWIINLFFLVLASSFIFTVKPFGVLIVGFLATDEAHYFSLRALSIPSFFLDTLT